jgi:poly(hydroxyalkanoate) depolymerase family esterase
MAIIDWRELYASNRAVIERARGTQRHPGTWEADTFTAGGRRRHALVHSPAGVDPRTAVPLVCMLHGCTQDAATIAAATKMNQAADRHGFAVIYPQQEPGENPQACWNWFLPEHQARGAGEPASIAALVRELVGTTSDLTIDADRVFVAGMSAGGAMAAILAAVYPDLFAAVAVHSGLAYRSATDLRGAFDAMARGGEDPVRHGRAAHAAIEHLARPIPSIVIHGTADRTVAPINAHQVLQQSMTINRLAAPETCDFDVARPTATTRDRVTAGHAYTRRQWTDRRGTVMHELLTVDGLGHAWSGGAAGGSHTDPRGPDATEAIWRFFSRAAERSPAPR